MSKAKYLSAVDAFDDWRDDVLKGEPPTLYPVGNGELSRIEVGPKLVTLIGGAPGAGKTAFTMQLVIDGLRLNDSLRVLVCAVEMPPSVLLDRQLARLSGIDATTIRYRRLEARHADRLDQAINTIEHIADRLCFLRPPFSLDNVAAAADDFGADLLLLDYIQRISPPGEYNDRRGSVDATMSYLRQFADAGVAVVAVAAVARQKDSRGRSSYASDALSLASFRESSELEFGADDCYILTSDSTSGDLVRLRHLKARHGEPIDLTLQFDRKRQRFLSPAKPTRTEQPKLDSRLQTSLVALWDRTEPAGDIKPGGDE